MSDSTTKPPSGLEPTDDDDQMGPIGILSDQLEALQQRFAPNAGVWAVGEMTDAEFQKRLEALTASRKRLQQLQHALLRPEVDYGLIPGTQQPTLLKPGAEKLCSFFRLVPTYHPNETIGDGLTTPPFSMDVECRLHLGHTGGPVVAVGWANCNAWEKKYRWRNRQKTCPTCGASTIFPKRAGGFYCHAARGGCGRNFEANDPNITGQPGGKEENPDPWELRNSILKIAQKRALVTVTLTATAGSDLFTQDIEDLDEADRGHGHAEGATQAPPAPGQAPATGRPDLKVVNGGKPATAPPPVNAPVPDNPCCHECGQVITKGQWGVSMRAFGTPLCPTHQKDKRADGGPAAPTPAAPPTRPPVPTGAPPVPSGLSPNAPPALACADCGKPVTKGQHDVSLRAFARPLCPEHQRLAGKEAQERREAEEAAADATADADAAVAEAEAQESGQAPTAPEMPAGSAQAADSPPQPTEAAQESPGGEAPAETAETAENGWDKPATEKQRALAKQWVEYGLKNDLLSQEQYERGMVELADPVTTKRRCWFVVDQISKADAKKQAEASGDPPK